MHETAPTRLPHQLQFEDWVPFPLAHVFAFFASPENLPRLMPPATETRIDRLDLVPPSPDSKAAGVGSTIVTSFRLFPFLPLRAQWIARITEFEWNHHFADVQAKGPFKRWNHRHEFQAEMRGEVNGTLVRDVIEYEVGLGSLGALFNTLFIRRQMRDVFTQRQKVLPDLLS
jgi:ligand-binding SRPBCC domain-containing protein